MPNQVYLRFNKKTLDRVPLPVAGQRATFHDIEVPGLQLRVTDRGVKSFCVFRRSHREYLASRGVTVIAIKRKDGKVIEQPQLAPNAKLKALTARDYVQAIAQALG